MGVDPKCNEGKSNEANRQRAPSVELRGSSGKNNEAIHQGPHCIMQSFATAKGKDFEARDAEMSEDGWKQRIRGGEFGERPFRGKHRKALCFPAM